MPPQIKPKLPLAALAEAMAELSALRDKVSVMPQELGAIFAAAMRSTADELAPLPEVHTSTDPLENAETAVQRLEEFFRDRDNEPATINQMCEGTGITYQTMRTFIYHRHKDKFRQIPLPMGRPGQWRWATLIPPDRSAADEPSPAGYRPDKRRRLTDRTLGGGAEEPS